MFITASALLIQQASIARAVGAHTATRTLAITESAELHLTSKHGFTLNEQGEARGTIRGTIYIHLHLVSDNAVTSEVAIYPSGGSLSGQGSAGYSVLGADASFSGHLKLTRGTGSYAGAHAASLSFKGTIERRDDAVSVHLTGPLSI